ncbi:replication-associated recombination protein A [Arcanobacterium hippocoleae]
MSDESVINAPLAVRMRPRVIAEVVGQEHLLRSGQPLRRLIESNTDGAPASIFLWGPPGIGKTTLAYLTAQSSGRKFVEVSAVSAGIKELRAVIDSAKNDLYISGKETILFIDEVHRFSKTQQDVLLPAVENRWVILIAATTENPSFSVISPLLSRSLLLTLHPLSAENIGTLIDRALTDPRGYDGDIALSLKARHEIIRLAGSDGRRALTILEAAASQALPTPDADGAIYENESGHENRFEAAGEETENAANQNTAETVCVNSENVTGNNDADGANEIAKSGEPKENGKNEDSEQKHPRKIITAEVVQQAVDTYAIRYDRSGDQHYNVISAFIKSVRGSDVDAAIHYLARMLEAGEDPRFIARRLMISAAEDVGMADPSALQTAAAAAQAVALVGMPEARIILAEAVVHLATAPKSNRAYQAINAAISDVRSGKYGEVPVHLWDKTVTASKVMAQQSGRDSEYKYAHDAPGSIVAQQYLPDGMLEKDIISQQTTVMKPKSQNV